MAEQLEAELRVTNLNVKPFAYHVEGMDAQGGESVEMRASGFWEKDGDHYPISLHATVYPGHGIVPALGDNITVTIERK